MFRSMVLTLGLAAAAAGTVRYEYVREWPLPGSWQMVYGLEVTGGNDVLVNRVLPNNTYIFRYTSAGSTMASWAMPPLGIGCFANDVCEDDAGYIWTGGMGWDPYSQPTYLFKLTPGLSLVASFLLPPGGVRTGGGLAARHGGYVYTTDADPPDYSSWLGKLTTGGSVVSSWSSETYYAGGIATDGAGFLYVACLYDVKKYTTAGSFVRSWGGYGSGDGQFKACTDVDVDSRGCVFALDRLGYRVQVFTSDGGYLGGWGEFGGGPGQFDLPYGLGIGAGDYVYVSEDGWNSGAPRVQIFRPTNVDVAPASLGKVKALFR